MDHVGDMIFGGSTNYMPTSKVNPKLAVSLNLNKQTNKMFQQLSYQTERKANTYVKYIVNLHSKMSELKGSILKYLRLTMNNESK